MMTQTQVDFIRRRGETSLMSTLNTLQIETAPTRLNHALTSGTQRALKVMEAEIKKKSSVLADTQFYKSSVVLHQFFLRFLVLSGFAIGLGKNKD